MTDPAGTDPRRLGPTRLGPTRLGPTRLGPTRLWASSPTGCGPGSRTTPTRRRARSSPRCSAAGDTAALADRFSGPLHFGTAGLRGPLRGGPNGMNRAVVRRTAAGLAAHLLTQRGPGTTVVVGRDARHGSADFLEDVGAVLAGAGVRALLLPRPLPTPVTAFAVRHLGLDAGVMVTASHNPPQDNGIKVFLSDGAQLVSPVDAQVEARIAAVGRVLRPAPRRRRGAR